MMTSDNDLLFFILPVVVRISLFPIFAAHISPFENFHYHFLFGAPSFIFYTKVICKSFCLIEIFTVNYIYRSWRHRVFVSCSVNYVLGFE